MTRLEEQVEPGGASLHAADETPSAWVGAPKADTRAFFAKHPELQDNKNILLELAFAEYLSRLEAGENLDPKAFSERFPSCCDSLLRLIETHHFVERNPELVVEPDPTPWPVPGEVFLGFHLERELGRGSFSRVFLARQQERDNREVVVKLTTHGGQAEAETLSRLCHPHIVPVFSAQQDTLSPLTAVCMPFLGNVTLKDVLDGLFAQARVPQQAWELLDAVQAGLPATASGGPRPARALRHGTYLEGVVHLGIQLAETLAFLHSRGILHRDLKPSNVLMLRDGRPMLLDFNLSCDTAAMPRCVGGTIRYAAPEQLQALGAAGAALPSTLDCRTDLFALGVILYELLTGKHPFGLPEGKRSFEEQRAYLLDAQQRGLLPVEKANPLVNPGLGRAIARCLALNPEERPRSAAELASALRGCQSNRSVALLQLPRVASSLVRSFRSSMAVHLRAAVITAIVLLGGGVVAAAGMLVREHNSYAELRHGQEACARRNFEEAVECFTRVLAVKPRDAAVLLARGRAYQRLGQLPLALSDLEKADELAPTGLNHACRAYCLQQLGQYHDASVHYERALEAGFATPAVYNNLGYCYWLDRRLIEARTKLDRAIEIDEHLQAAYHNRALVDLDTAYARGKDYFPHTGITDIEKAIYLGPATAELYFDEARLYAIATRASPTQIEPALQAIAHALDLGWSPQELTDNVFQGVREDPRFRKVLANTRASHPSTRAVRAIDPHPDR
jgi:serine/threonine protein kinase/Tfp pilus assembly protein PilF